jgi:hypothetical protein
VGDKHSLRIQGLVMQTIAAIAVAASANFVEEGAVHSVLKKERESEMWRGGMVNLIWQYLLRAEDGSKTIGHGIRK